MDRFDMIKYCSFHLECIATIPGLEFGILAIGTLAELLRILTHLAD